MEKLKLTKEQRQELEDFMGYPDGYLSEFLRWNDIMPIMEHIENMGYETHLQHRTYDQGRWYQLWILKGNSIVAETLTDVEWIESAEKNTKLGATLKGIENFIKILNKQKDADQNRQGEVTRTD